MVSLRFLLTTKEEISMKDQEIDFNIIIRDLPTKDKEGDILPGSIPVLIGTLLVNPRFGEDEPTRKLLIAQKIGREEKCMMNKADFDLVMKAIKFAKSTHDGRVIGGLLLVLGAIKWED